MLGPSLSQMHFLYQYSLQFFLDIYHTVLYENSNLKGVSDHTQRLSLITKDLFQVSAEGLHTKHKCSARRTSPASSVSHKNRFIFPVQLIKAHREIQTTNFMQTCNHYMTQIQSV